MVTIATPIRITDNFGDGFNQYFDILKKMLKVEEQRPITIDMAHSKALNPFFLLPFYIHLIDELKNRSISINTGSPDNDMAIFLRKTGFFPPFNKSKSINIQTENYIKLLDEYRMESYIPIIEFPALRDAVNTDKRNELLSKINNVIVEQLNIKGSFQTGIMYLIDEAINNIVDHSGEKFGYIYSQYFKANGYIDICIADKGIGILESYKNVGKHMKTNAEAIINAANGISVKNRPDAEGRGFGISTSLNMAVNGLNGKYFIISGNAFLMKNIQEETVSNIEKQLSYNGTLVAIRIPCSTRINFTPSDYYG